MSPFFQQQHTRPRISLRRHDRPKKSRRPAARNDNPPPGILRLSFLE
jgi:hypothetical protein